MQGSRRRFLLSATALSSCGPKLAKRFNGYVFVASQATRGISVVNLTRFHMEKEIGLGGEPILVLNIPNTRRVLALTPSSVTEVDAGPMAITRHAKVATSARTMTLSPDGTTLWILAQDPQALLGLDLRTWRVNAHVKLPAEAAGFDVSEDGKQAALSLPQRKSVAIVDLATAQLRKETGIGADPGVIRFRPDGKQILIGNKSARNITILDAESGRQLVTLPLPMAPEQFCFTTDHGGQMFVSGQGMDAIAIVAPYQTVVSETILAGSDPGAMNANDTFLFVASKSTGDLTVVNIETRKVLAKIPVGQEPIEILLTNDGEYVLILNRKSSDLAVVRVSKISDFRYKRAPLFTVVPVGENPVSATICHL